MSEFEVPVSIKCDWNSGRFCWWVHVVTHMSIGLREDIVLVNAGLEVERGAVFDGSLEFSVDDLRLFNFVPHELEVYYPQWLAVHGKDGTDFYTQVLSSLRRMCRFASLLCAANRSGFEVNFKVRTLSSILWDEVFQRLEGIGEHIPKDLLIVDLHELIVSLLRCAISAADLDLFDDLFTVIGGKFDAVEWIDDRSHLLMLLRDDCDDMTEWMSYLDSTECYKAARSEVADFEMIKAVLIEATRASRTRRL